MAEGDRSTEQLARTLSSSVARGEQLLRDLIDPRDTENNEADGMIQYLRAIAANTAFTGCIPKSSSVVTNAAAQTDLLFKGLPDTPALIFDLFGCVGGATTLSFQDEDGNDLFPRYFGASSGQGFSFNSVKGLFMPSGRSLYVASSAAVNHSVIVSYALLD